MNKVRNKTKATLIITIPIVLFGVYLVSQNNQSTKYYEPVKTMDKLTVHIPEPIKQPKQKEQIDVNTAQPVTVEQLPADSEPENPIVLSSQEYGQKYLDLSDPLQQKCFDAIVNDYPERFTEENRENNIKALRAFVSPCSTGAYSERGARTTNLLDVNGRGAFFDSDLAKANH